MDTYEIFDMRGGSFKPFDELPKVEASSPKQAAEKYVGAHVRRTNDIAGDILVAKTVWPRTRYLYVVLR